jgi:transcriptional regulator with XRE-family HTH domain
MYNLILLTNILRILDDIGMTKSELAKKAGMSVSFLSDLTHDHANPSLRIMEAIAHALDTPLPALLETTDLDRQTLEELAGGKSKLSLPEGYMRVAAILTEYQAFTVRQWDENNRKRLDATKVKRKAVPAKKTSTV